MQLFLQILSVIGIILLCILALLLLILLCILFVPVRYRADGSKEEKDWSVSVKASWMFGLFRIAGMYPRPGVLRVKVLFFTIFTLGGENKTSDLQKETSRSTETKSSQEPTTDTVSDGTDRHAESKTEEKQIPDSEKEKRKGIGGLIEAWKQSIRQKWKKIRYTIRSLCDKIKKIRENWDYYRALLEDETTKVLFGKYKRKIGKVLKSIGPRKIKADIVFGTGSPDTTGYALAAYSMLYPYIGNDVNVVPDFEQAILEGNIKIRGRIRIIVLLHLIITFMLDKEMKSWIHKIKREDM